MKNNVIIDIHVIQTVPPSCVNRDDTGSPKTARYGGKIRARVSSQSWKKAVRDYFVSEGLDNEWCGIRTDKIPELLAKSIVKHDNTKTLEEALKISQNIFESIEKKLLKDDKKEQIAKMSAITFISEAQIDAMAKVFTNNPKASKDDYIIAWKAKPSIDMALFGRMLASVPTLNIDACCQVAHAISTHEIQTEYDFYTATDDCSKEGEQGAINLGTAEYYSCTLYRFASINAGLLKNTINDTENKITPEAIKEFVKSFIISMPSAKQNSFGNKTLPEMIYVSVRNDQTLNLVNAFEKPVNSSNGYSEASVKCFIETAKGVYEMYGAKPQKEFFVCLYNCESIGEKKSFCEMLDSLNKELVDLLKE